MLYYPFKQAERFEYLFYKNKNDITIYTLFLYLLRWTLFDIKIV